MRRKTRRLMANFVFFGSALLLIIYFNHYESNSKTFEWTTIRYKTTSTTLPKARGTCPSLSNSTKPALVVSRVAADGDPKWLDPLTDLYHLCIYTADAPTDTASTNLHVPANRGHEAMAYLTFLIDNYADIPAAGAVFVHGSRWAWHNDGPNYDNVDLLAALNVSAALTPAGYHNLRCDWSASMCEPGYALPQGSLEVSLDSVLEPWNARAVSDAALPGALKVLFGGDEGVPPSGERVVLGRADAVRSQCCAQFVVSRERVWQHTRDEYHALRQWLLDGSSDTRNNEHSQRGNAAPSDDRVAGRILSYLWHILFLQQARESSPGVGGLVDLERLNELACPHANHCYCRLYGRCDLDCETPGHCRGQYVLPPNFRLPDDWMDTHSLVGRFMKDFDTDEELSDGDGNLLENESDDGDHLLEDGSAGEEIDELSFSDEHSDGGSHGKEALTLHRPQIPEEVKQDVELLRDWELPTNYGEYVEAK